MNVCGLTNFTNHSGLNQRQLFTYRIKSRLKTFQPENGQKFKNNEPQSKLTGSYKKSVFIRRLVAMP